MVSLNTVLAIGGIGAAYIIFKNLGGAAGIGSSIGSGFNNFGNSIIAGLNLKDTIENANKFDNPLNTSVPDGFRIDPTENRNYDDYINYNDPTPTPTDNPPFIFPDPPSSIGGGELPNRYTWENRSKPIQTIFTDQTIPNAPTPPFAGNLEFVFNRYEKEPESIHEVVSNFGTSTGRGRYGQ